MCGFEPGDLVVCVKAAPTLKPSHRYPDNLAPLVAGAAYTIRAVGEVFDGWGVSEGVAVWLEEARWTTLAGTDGGFCPSRFRKVERKSDSLSIEAFLTIKPNQFEGPKRTNQPAKRKEQA